jgi:hypothetical protein
MFSSNTGKSQFETIHTHLIVSNTGTVYFHTLGNRLPVPVSFYNELSVFFGPVSPLNFG